MTDPSQYMPWRPLGDGPTYDVKTDTAWWFDILERRLFEARLDSGRISVHRLGRIDDDGRAFEAGGAVDSHGVLR